MKLTPLIEGYVELNREELNECTNNLISLYPAIESKVNAKSMLIDDFVSWLQFMMPHAILQSSKQNSSLTQHLRGVSIQVSDPQWYSKYRSETVFTLRDYGNHFDNMSDYLNSMKSLLVTAATQQRSDSGSVDIEMRLPFQLIISGLLYSKNPKQWWEMFIRKKFMPVYAHELTHVVQIMKHKKNSIVTGKRYNPALKYHRAAVKYPVMLRMLSKDANDKYHESYLSTPEEIQAFARTIAEELRTMYPKKSSEELVQLLKQPGKLSGVKRGSIGLYHYIHDYRQLLKIGNGKVIHRLLKTVYQILKDDN